MRNTPKKTSTGRTTAGTTANANASAGQFLHLSEMDDYKIADGEPDIRGWDVKSLDGQTVGEVDDLLVDTATMRVRYIEMKLDKKLEPDDHRRYALVPIGSARLDDDNDDVLVNVRGNEFAAMPPYTRGTVTREYERELLSRYGHTPAASGAAASADRDDFYRGEHFDENRAFGGRRKATTGTTGDDRSYLTRSEEELQIGKRKVEAGSVGVSKHVETEHVRQAVPVTREEVTVERRPITGDTRTGDARIENDEIRVPVMEEEVVASKRAVAKEEVVIRKDIVEDERVVEADLKRERLDIDRGDEGRTGRSPR